MVQLNNITIPLQTIEKKKIDKFRKIFDTLRAINSTIRLNECRFFTKDNIIEYLRFEIIVDDITAEKRNLSI